MLYRIFLYLILLISSVLGYYSLHEGHNWGGDFALYMNQAQSIIEGNSEEILKENVFSMQQSTQLEGANPQIGPHLYPWGFPILLVPVYALFGSDIFMMKISVLCFFVVSLILVYYLFRNRIGNTYSLLIVALLAFNPKLLELLDDVGSDIPFTFFALLSLVFIQKLISSNYVNRSFTLIITGFLIFFAFLIRTNGIVLLGTLLVCQFIYVRQCNNLNKYKFSQLKIELLPYISFGILLLIMKLILPDGSGSHLAFLSQTTPGKLAYNLIYYTTLPAEFYSSTPLPYMLFGVSMPFVFWGVFKRISKDYHYIVYSIGTWVIFVAWPPLQGLRFIISLLPFYLYFLFYGIGQIETKIIRENVLPYFKRPWLSSVFALVLLGFFLVRASNSALANMKQRKLVTGPYEPASQELFAFINTNTRGGDIIVFFKPRVINLFTERTAIRVVKYQEIVGGKGDYLVLSKSEDFGQLTENDIQQIQHYLSVVFENECFTIYKIGY